jgi:hypothetical protein
MAEYSDDEILELEERVDMPDELPQTKPALIRQNGITPKKKQASSANLAKARQTKLDNLKKAREAREQKKIAKIHQQQQYYQLSEESDSSEEELVIKKKTPYRKKIQSPDRLDKMEELLEKLMIAQTHQKKVKKITNIQLPAYQQPKVNPASEQLKRTLIDL